jgi:CheY-like chemotaxis protein
VVDDEEVVRQSLASLVEALGHAPIAASSGEEALQMLLAETPVHLVILDLKMPGLGGMATLEALRRLRPDLPVVLVTGHADQEAEELCQRHPRVSLMPKPFTLAEIKAHLGLVQGLRG